MSFNDSPRTPSRAVVYVQVQIESLLNDDESDFRVAGALIVGNLYFSGKIEQKMMDVFDRETDQTVRLYLAWAHHFITE